MRYGRFLIVALIFVVVASVFVVTYGFLDLVGLLPFGGETSDTLDPKSEASTKILKGTAAARPDQQAKLGEAGLAA